MIITCYINPELGRFIDILMLHRYVKFITRFTTVVAFSHLSLGGVSPSCTDWGAVLEIKRWSGYQFDV